MKQDNLGNTYSYDVEGRPTTAAGIQLAHDAFGRTVELNNGGTYTEMAYAPSGWRHAVMNGTTLNRYIDPMVAGMAAVHNGPNGNRPNSGYFQHADWLGSSRLAVTGGGTATYDRSYAAFGEPYNETATMNRNFTGQTEDTTPGLYDFLFRQQSSAQGRWLVPDPAGLAAVDITNPQTWNRYAYVGNNPLSNVDPLGLSCEDPHDGTPCNVNVTAPAEEAPTDYVELPGCVGLFGGSVGLGCSNGGWRIIGGLNFIDNINRFTFKAPGANAPNNSGCQAGPLNLSQNIQTAKSLAGQFWSGVLNAGSIGGAASAGAAAGTYVGLVQTGGAWDPKNGPGGPTAVNIAAGNINFGATCSQFGFNTALGGQVCQFGAGIYGKLSGVYGSPLFSKYHGDIPSDNQQIQQGLAIARKGGC